MAAYYNEIDPFAAAWLRALIREGHLPVGEVDERSIVAIDPRDLRGFTQCHFFAGIGGWPYALRLAGFPDDRPVWTGSCPCQPFSVAGAQRGSDDERHLWPAWFRLIRECRPAEVFGEQVAGSAGLAWLDHVCSDLEDADYAAAAADLPAGACGATHKRHRLWWVAADTARVDGHAHDRLEPRGTRGASQSARRLHSVYVAATWWQARAGTSHLPLLVRNHHGLSHVLAGLGNAIVPQVAAVFVGAYMDATR